MKLGLILECPLKGTDQQVYEYIIKKLHNSIEIAVAGNVNKKFLLEDCGSQAKMLFTDKCDYVAIIWDLMPRWEGEKACRKEDVDKILTKLKEKQVDLSKIKLICVEPELEGIFIVDGHALTSYQQQLCHPHSVEIFRPKKLAKNYKGTKTDISRYLCRKYNDVAEAFKIAQHITDYHRIARKFESFKRLKEFVESLR